MQKCMVQMHGDERTGLNQGSGLLRVRATVGIFKREHHAY